MACRLKPVNRRVRDAPHSLRPAARLFASLSSWSPLPALRFALDLLFFLPAPPLCSPAPLVADPIGAAAPAAAPAPRRPSETRRQQQIWQPCTAHPCTADAVMSVVAAVFAGVAAVPRQEGPPARLLAADSPLPYRRPRRLGPRNESSRAQHAVSTARLLAGLSSPPAGAEDERANNTTDDEARAAQEVWSAYRAGSGQQDEAGADPSAPSVGEAVDALVGAATRAVDGQAAQSVGDAVGELVWAAAGAGVAVGVTLGGEPTANAKDADHAEATDADGSAMRTTRITWALPEVAALTNESNVTTGHFVKLLAVADGG